MPQTHLTLWTRSKESKSAASLSTSVRRDVLEDIIINIPLRMNKSWLSLSIRTSFDSQKTGMFQLSSALRITRDDGTDLRISAISIRGLHIAMYQRNISSLK